jgi:hypothetical protein
MNRDPRYSVLLSMYEKGHIKSLFDIFKYVPKTRVGLDIGMRVDRLNKFLKRVETFTLKDIESIAALADLDLDVTMELWRKEYRQQKEMRKKVKVP